MTINFQTAKNAKPNAVTSLRKAARLRRRKMGKALPVAPSEKPDRTLIKAARRQRLGR